MIHEIYNLESYKAQLAQELRDEPCGATSLAVSISPGVSGIDDHKRRPCVGNSVARRSGKLPEGLGKSRARALYGALLQRATTMFIRS